MTGKADSVVADTFVGMFATVTAGHDKGQTYLIIKDEDDFVYLADGRKKGTGNPRKKRKKHIQVIKTRDQALAEKLMNGKTIYNEEIRFAIKMCRQSQNK